mmetsp:Transcript_147784/g.472973  ORF Transcript_147784/g.472973 Transcript_147784/m.472973 type:complete len:105 (-) Transcript_147784:103-417(-)
MGTVFEEEEARVLKCKHNFHAECIDNWWMRKQLLCLECPTCRQSHACFCSRVRTGPVAGSGGPDLEQGRDVEVDIAALVGDRQLSVSPAASADEAIGHDLKLSL